MTAPIGVRPAHAPILNAAAKPGAVQYCVTCGTAILWRNGEPFTLSECLRCGHWCQRCGRPMCDSGKCHAKGEHGYDELCQGCDRDLDAIAEQEGEAE